jgi:hypothetical protein
MKKITKQTIDTKNSSNFQLEIFSFFTEKKSFDHLMNKHRLNIKGQTDIRMRMCHA